MNKIRVVIFATLVCLFLVNCNKKKDHLLFINKFPDEQYLTGRPIEDISFNTKSSVLLTVIDTFLVVQKSESSILLIYSTADYKLLTSIGNTGKGPNEFIFPKLTKQTYFDKTNNSPVLCVYDIARRRFSTINVLNAIDNQVEKVFNELPIPDYDQFFTYFFYRDSSLMVATPENGPRFIIYADSTKSYKEVAYMPELNFKIDKKKLEVFESTKYASASLVNIELGRIVSAPFLLGEIDFFNLTGELILSAVFETKDNLKKSLNNEDENRYSPKFYIVDMQGAEQFIYALNYDNYQYDYVYGKNCSSQSILMFDWDGKPLKKYILDTAHFIRYFAVDKINNRFYGFCLEEPDHPIIVYDF